MAKTIIITERQLKEIVGADSSYLDATDTDFKEYNGQTEISATGGKTSNKKDGKPVTGDEYASKLSKNGGFMKNTVSRSLPLNCGKKKVKLKEENEAGENRKWRVPDEILKTLMNNRANFSGDKNDDGWDRLNFIISNPDLGYDEMRRLKNYFDNDAQANDENFNLLGGQAMKNWNNQSLKAFTGSTASNNQNLKTLGVKMDTVNSGNGQGHSTSSTFDGKVSTFNGETSTF